MEFSQRFTAILEQKSITPYRIFKDTGIPEATVGRWKNGKAIPSADMLVKLADYLHLDTDYLLCKTDKKNKPASDLDDRLKGIEKLYEICTDFSDEEYQKLLDYAQLLAAQPRRSNEE